MQRNYRSRWINSWAPSGRYLRTLLNEKRYKLILSISAVVYFLVYLISIGNIVYLPGVNLAGTAPIPSAVFSEDWPARTWKTLTPFVWEPVGTLYLANSLQILISIPNYLIGVLLSVLIGLNVAVAVNSFAIRKTLVSNAGSGSFRGLLGSIPSFLTGFTCCAPSFIVALGPLAAGATLAIIEVRPYFIPAAVIAMGFVLLWNTRKLHGVCNLTLNTTARRP